MNKKYDFCVIITTYNRPKMLLELLTKIENEKKHFEILVLIFDDCSTEKYELPRTNIKKITMSSNMGKKKFWKIIDTSFKTIKNIKSKYFIYLQDDVSIIENFFSNLVNQYEEINDDKKITLSFLTDQRITKPNWTKINPINIGNVVKTQWVELHFICEKKFFEHLDYKLEPIPLSRWENNPNLSSGVGCQLSNRLNKKGLGMYHTKKTLVTHGDHESYMNKHERKINKLIS